MEGPVATDRLPIRCAYIVYYATLPSAIITAPHLRYARDQPTLPPSPPPTRLHERKCRIIRLLESWKHGHLRSTRRFYPSVIFLRGRPNWSAMLNLSVKRWACCRRIL